MWKAACSRQAFRSRVQGIWTGNARKNNCSRLFHNAFTTRSEHSNIPFSSGPSGHTEIKTGSGGQGVRVEGSETEPIYAPPAPQGYQVHAFPESFQTEWGQTIPCLSLAFETWGSLNAQKNNGILLFGGYTTSTHARSHSRNTQKGWFEFAIGPGRPLDTDKFFILCCDYVGGCFGSVGPSSINPESQEPYGLRFPFVSLGDIVKSQFLLLDKLGIQEVHTVIGGSLGGMLSLCAATLFPERVKRVVSIAGTARSHPSGIALRYIQRHAIMSDPNFANGDYYRTSKRPSEGLRIAREIGTMTFRSGLEWSTRFGRRRINGSLERPTMGTDFQVEGYLEHQGYKWSKAFDANTFLYLCKAMDYFSLEAWDPKTNTPCLAVGLKNVQMPVLVLGLKTDMLIPIHEQREMAHALREAGNSEVLLYEIDSPIGHDAFLLENPTIANVLRGFLSRVI